MKKTKRSAEQIDQEIRDYLKYDKKEGLSKFLLKINIRHSQLKERVEKGLVVITKKDQYRFVSLA